MDQSLDEISGDRQQRNGGNRGRQGRRNNRNDYPRDGVRKPYQGDDSRNIDSEWVHDKYDDRNARSSNRPERRNYEEDRPINSGKVRVENVHYDLTEEELEGLFERIGRVSFLKLDYDRAGRSNGVAHVTYEDPRDAQRAIEEFDGANANGQPIRLRSVPDGPSRGRGGRNQYEPSRSGRSLADRMTIPRSRSLSPPIRHSDVSKPPPENVDRYVPGDRGDRPDRRRRSRSPLPRRGRDGRRPGARRERGDRNAGRGGERPTRESRPKKTQEELDAEMDDYFGNGSKQEENVNDTANEAPVAAPEHNQTGDDIEMVE